jgi:hypothetical protein
MRLSPQILPPMRGFLKAILSLTSESSAVLGNKQSTTLQERKGFWPWMIKDENISPYLVDSRGRDVHIMVVDPMASNASCKGSLCSNVWCRVSEWKNFPSNGESNWTLSGFGINFVLWSRRENGWCNFPKSGEHYIHEPLTPGGLVSKHSYATFYWGADDS